MNVYLFTDRSLAVEFRRGYPIAVDGQPLEPVQLLERLNEIGARHGVGRIDIVENRLVGMKSRGVYETPGGTILREAHEALEGICLDRETSHFKAGVALRYSELVYHGQWFSPLREALCVRGADAGDRERSSQTGAIQTVGASNRPELAFSLYCEEFATFGRDEVYSQADAEGFIHLFGLPQKIRHIALKSALPSPSPSIRRWEEKEKKNDASVRRSGDGDIPGGDQGMKVPAGRPPSKLWGGRFRKPTAQPLEDLGRSIDFDRRLWAEEVRINRV